MIRINLIASGSSTKRASGDGLLLELIVLGLLVGVGAFAVFLWYNSMEDRLAMARVKVAQEKAMIRGLAKAKRTLRLFQAKQRELKKQLKIINTLKRQKQGPVRILDQISMRIPERVWLTSVRQGKRGRLQLNGKAESNEVVAIFLKRLEESPYFKTVDLQQIVRRRFQMRDDSDINKTKTVIHTVFSVDCTVRFAVSDT